MKTAWQILGKRKMTPIALVSEYLGYNLHSAFPHSYDILKHR